MNLGPQRLLRWAGLLSCLFAVTAIIVPIVAYARVATAEGVHINGEQQELTVTPKRAYGVYFNDADNGGYSHGCSAEDGRGRSIHLDDPPWGIGSETETLDHVFRSPTDVVMIDCSIQGATASIRPLPSNGSLLVGGAIAAALAWLGVFTLVAARRRDEAIVSASPTASGGHGEELAQRPSAPTPPPASDRNLIPAIVATAVGLPLLGLQVLGWIALVVTVPSAFDEPELWEGRPEQPGPSMGPSMWDVARSSWWPELLPVGVGAVLILATWLLAVRRLPAAAWATSAIACAAAMVSLVV